MITWIEKFPDKVIPEKSNKKCNSLGFEATFLFLNGGTYSVAPGWLQLSAQLRHTPPPLPLNGKKGNSLIELLRNIWNCHLAKNYEIL